MADQYDNVASYE